MAAGLPEEQQGVQLPDNHTPCLRFPVAGDHVAIAGYELGGKERACLEQVREWRDKELLPLIRSWGDRPDLEAYAEAEFTLVRYCYARRYDVKAACKMLRESVEWRRARVYPGLRCGLCERDVNSHCMVSLGIDKTGCALIYASPPRATNLTPKETVDHIVVEIERGMKLAGCTGKWRWVVDFKGYTLWQMLDPSLGIEYAKVFSRYYPERLGGLLLLQPPGFFQVLMAMVMPFIDERSRHKIVQVPLAEAEQALETLLFPDQLAWVKAAMELEAKPGRLPPALPLRAPLPAPEPLSQVVWEVKEWRDARRSGRSHEEAEAAAAAAGFQPRPHFHAEALKAKQEATSKADGVQ